LLTEAAKDLAAIVIQIKTPKLHDQVALVDSCASVMDQKSKWVTTEPKELLEFVNFSFGLGRPDLKLKMNRPTG